MPLAVPPGAPPAPPVDETLDLRTFETKYRALLHERQTESVNEKCVQMLDCTGCSLSTFCSHCQHLTRSHYCTSCEHCTDCSHCNDSSALLGCNHCDNSTECIGSSYLVQCKSMTHCQYCFGCVGLARSDFHILNQPYDRSTYFRITRKLIEQMRG